MIEKQDAVTQIEKEQCRTIPSFESILKVLEGINTFDFTASQLLLPTWPAYPEYLVLQATWLAYTEYLFLHWAAYTEYPCLQGQHTQNTLSYIAGI